MKQKSKLLIIIRTQQWDSKYSLKIKQQKIMN